MKLASLKSGRDGRLVVVSRDLHWYADASHIAPSLQAALDDWEHVAPQLELLATDLEHEAIPRERFHEREAAAPLPRAYEWIDGSAYINHIVLVRMARNAELPATLKTDPLVYQGASGRLLGPTHDIQHYSEEYGIDFESEITVVTDDVPMGTQAKDAAQHIKLFMLANDVTLRNLIPPELEKGFGFFVSKPATAFSPFAVTPDELGSAWHDGRVHLPLRTLWNGKLFGNPDSGPEMHFSFLDLLQHVTKTRWLTAGTIVGSGTISNEDEARGSSCIAEARMREKIKTGQFKTSFMQFGDTVEIEMRDSAGRSLFGSIQQRVVQAKRAS